MRRPNGLRIFIDEPRFPIVEIEMLDTYAVRMNDELNS